MSTQPTKEKEMARFEELKAIGYKKLKGADREEYSTLLEKYPELEKDAELKDEDEDENKGDDEKEKDEGENEESDKKEKPPVKNSSKKTVKMVEKNYFTLKGNVIHSGEEFVKGQQIPIDHELVKTFQQQGLLE